MILADKIAICIDDLLQVVPHTEACPDDVLPGDIAEYVHDGGDQRGLCVVRRLIGVPYSDATHKKVKMVQFRGTGRPDVLLPAVGEFGGTSQLS